MSERPDPWERVAACDQRAFYERQTLDVMGLAAYRRCRAGGLTHGEAMGIAREDMAIRASLARKAMRGTVRR